MFPKTRQFSCMITIPPRTTRVFRSTPNADAGRGQQPWFEKHVDGALNVPETSSVFVRVQQTTAICGPSFRNGVVFSRPAW